MLKIRLSRTGKRNRPSYRIVATDSRNKREGRLLGILGHFDPHQPKKDQFKIDKEALDKYVSQGAQLSDAVKKIISNEYEYKKYEGSKKGGVSKEEPNKTDEDTETKEEVAEVEN